MLNPFKLCVRILSITLTGITSGKMAAKANKFCALRENEIERDVDDANGTSFENEVNEAVKVGRSSQSWSSRLRQL